MNPAVYKEGLLFKRQRGLHQNNTRKLKFQERFCQLTSASLDYYDPNPRKRGDGPKGQFAVDHMKVVEPMQDFMFGSSFAHVFQIGDNAEIMYFACHSARAKQEWIQAFRQAAVDASNKMQSHHHHGVFGLVNKGRWSCCANPQRTCTGCSPVSTGKPKEFTQTLPVSLDAAVLPDPPSVGGAELQPEPQPQPSPNSHSLPREIKPLQEEPSTTPSTPPKIRSFTIVDPLMKPNSRRLKEIRKSTELESLALPVKSLDLSDKSKLDEIDGKLADDSTMLDTKYGDSVIKNGRGSETDVAKIKSDLKPQSNDRNGTDSPCPSIDSGHGASSSSSRPGSQIIAPPDDSSAVCVMKSVGENSDQPLHTHQTPNSNMSTPAVEDGSGDGEVEGSFSKEEEFGQVPAMKTQLQSVPLRTPPHGRNRGVSMPPAPADIIRHENSSRPLSGSFRSEPWDKRVSMAGSDVSSPVTPLHKIATGSPRLGDDGKPRPMSFMMRSVYGQPPSEFNKLHQACKDGNLSSLADELRLADHMDINELSYGRLKYTPLLLAVLYDHYQAMVVLLEHGANPNCIEPQTQVSILHWACERGCEEIADVLIKYKADVNQCDANGRSALSSSCKNGYCELVEMLMDSGAEVDVEDAYGRSPLHEAAEFGHVDIVELLIKRGGSDPLARDNNDASPYDLAYKNNHQEVMKTLQMIMPAAVRPYALTHSYEAAPGSRMITSLSYYGSRTLVVGSRDCYVTIWDTSDTSNAIHRIHLTDTVLDLHLWSNYLVIGCSSIQIVDMENQEKRRTVADDSHEDESLENPPLHLAAFGPKGQLVTAGVESNILKIWPPQTLGIISAPQATLTVGEEHADKGCIYSVSVSPTPNHPWLAVGLQPGKLFEARGNKLVYLYDWVERKLCHIFDAGNGGVDVSVHVQFSPDGGRLAVGCTENLCIWETSSGNLLHKFPVTTGTAITSIQYSPDGSNLAAGLNSGEINVFEITCSSLVFQLPGTKVPSPATGLAYSEDGKNFAAAYQCGMVQLWEVFAGQPSNS